MNEGELHIAWRGVALGYHDRQKLHGHRAARLPQPMWPRDVVPVATFPMTANGKLDRMRFRAEWKP